MTNPIQEDFGLIEIHRVSAQMHAIWRPTPCHDLGIDGQIEFLEPDTIVSTGHIVAIQSKSGPSYFQNNDRDFVKYYPEEKHRKYWKRLKIPVFLVLHNPDTETTIYTSVKPQLYNNGPILVNKNKIFNKDCRGNLIGIAEKSTVYPSPSKILKKFKKIELIRDGNKILTGIDFLLACTNRKQRYFELRMRRVCALFSLLSEEGGTNIGSSDYEFILRNVIAVHTNKITEDFLEEFEFVWYELSSVPDILAQLTPIGEDVFDHLWSNPNNFIDLNSYTHMNIKDPYQLILAISEYAQNCSDRLDSSDRMSIESK